MKNLIDFFQKKGLIFKKFEPVDLKKYGIRKRVSVFNALTVDNKYMLIIFTSRKSRVLVKDAQSYEEVSELLSKSFSHGFKKKILITDAPVCAKAQSLLKSINWRIEIASL
ncbi:hypothetical protein [Nitrosophilus alvini]|uniref:hypothetical protein n=1 Tax=Nitrosophilus alvini TaxID=2714855 RepID=UPI00190E48EF|nr:hypothetical protein [Nitrosophilus alvini]